MSGNTITLLIVGLSSIFFIVAVLSSLKKIYINKNPDKGDKNKYYWEVPVSVIALYTALIGFYLDDHYNETSDLYATLRQDILEYRAIRYLENPDDRESAYIMQRSVQDIWDNKPSPIRWYRSIFTPVEAPGPNPEQDEVIYRLIRSIGNMRASYIIGIINNQVEQRREMLKFLFDYLTKPVWESLYEQNINLEILPVNFNRRYNTWLIESPDGKRGGAEIYSLSYDMLIREAIVVTDEENIIQLIIDDLINLRESSLSLLKIEEEKDYWNQEPFMIFYDPSSYLRPMSLTDLNEKWDYIYTRWRYDHGNVPLTNKLQELNDLIIYINNRRKNYE